MADGPTSTNPVVKSIISGNAPPAARSAAARGLLPLPQADLLEALVHLRSDSDAEVARAAQATLDAQEPGDYLNVARANDTAPSVLGYLASQGSTAPETHEAVATANTTPDDPIAHIARLTSDPSLLEF